MKEIAQLEEESSLVICSRLWCCKRKTGDAEGDHVSDSKSQWQKWRRREGVNADDSVDRRE